jgi:exopolysaccharide production protein ExoQ
MSNVAPNRRLRPGLAMDRAPDGNLAHDVVMVLFIVWFLNPFAPFVKDFDVSAQFSAAVAGAVAPESNGSEFLRLSWLPVHATIVLLALSRWREMRAIVATQGLLVMVLGFAVLSTLWSVNPEVTFRRSIALVVSSTFGVYLTVAYSQMKLIRLLAAAFAITVAASFIFAVLQPDIATTSVLHEGSWRGVFVNKNGLGQMMLLGCLVRLILMVADRRVLRHLAWFVLSGALLFLSGAKTPLFVGAAVVTIIGLIHKFQVDRRRFSFFAALAIVLGVLLLTVAGPAFTAILTLLGKDPTLTGRTEIWSLVWNAVQPRFWIGYGYGAFWSNPEGPASEIWDILNWQVPNAHSGVLELWLGLGLIGVMLFAALAVSTMKSILRRAAFLNEAAALWLICYAAIFHAYTLGESATLEQNAANWVLFCTVIAASRQAARPMTVVARPRRPGSFARPGFGAARPFGRNLRPR